MHTPKGLKASKARAKSVMVSFFFVTLFVHTRDGVKITFFQGVLGSWDIFHAVVGGGVRTGI